MMNTEKTTRCLLCGAESELCEEKFPGYQEPDTFKIYSCKSCNTSFAWPHVDTDGIYNRIYELGADVPGYNRYYKYREIVKTHKDPLKYLSQIEEAYCSVSTALKDKVKDKQNTKILEVGCGMGYLTYSLIRAGYHATGLDISQSAINEAINYFGNHYVCADLLRYVVEHKEQYDIIILTEVIEHISSPIKFLETCYSLLKGSGSMVIMTTPNKSIFPQNAIWNTDLPPVHLWWFSEDSMQYMASKLNMKAQFINLCKHKTNRLIPRMVNLNINTICPVLNENGELIQKKSKNPVKLFLKKIPFVLVFHNNIINFYYYLKNRRNVNFIKIRNSNCGIIYTK